MRAKKLLKSKASSANRDAGRLSRRPKWRPSQAKIDAHAAAMQAQVQARLGEQAANSTRASASRWSKPQRRPRRCNPSCATRSARPPNKRSASRSTREAGGGELPRRVRGVLPRDPLPKSKRSSNRSARKRSTEVTRHSLKTADWYQKKAQTAMQASLEKASSNPRQPCATAPRKLPAWLRPSLTTTAAPTSSTVAPKSRRRRRKFWIASAASWRDR